MHKMVSSKSSRVSGLSSRTHTSSRHHTGLRSQSSSQMHRSARSDDTKKDDYRLMLKCIKYSPHLQPRPAKDLRLLEFEQKVWTETMQSMGGLEKAKIPPPPIYDHIADNPYHCIPKDREFDARFGVQNPWRPIEVPPVRRQNPNRCNIIQRSQLPIYKPPCRADLLSPRVRGSLGFGETDYYLPPSAVRAVYVDHMGLDLSFNDLGSLLAIHGQVMFSLVESPRTMVVVFEWMRDAARAVRYDAYPRGLRVTWVDARLNNMGHYLGLQNYRVSKDEVWNSGVRRRFGLRSSPSVPSKEKHSISRRMSYATVQSGVDNKKPLKFNIKLEKKATVKAPELHLSHS